jgi:phosphoglycolate phosphatase-like HAD superfamily hydrolase
VAGLESGRIKPEEMVMEGSFELLEALKARGMELYLASGTDHSYVKDEAAALGVDRYFEDNIFGAVDHSTEHSKARIIQDIIRGHGLGGDSLLVFGDGFVEIENCKTVGGFAVGVASDEVNRMGLNGWKRTRLISAGADIIVTDYRDYKALVDYLVH